MNPGRNKFVLFAIGLFSKTQIYVGGAIGLSELIVFAVAPFVFISNYKNIKRDGFIPLISLVLLSLLGCFISCRINAVDFAHESRGLMANYGLFASIVVMHRLLRDNLKGVGWLALGMAISLVISSFTFYGTTELAQYAGGDVRGATDAILQSPLFWAGRLGAFWTLPYSGWYRSMPQTWNWLSAIVWGGVSMFISQGSGRSMGLTLLFSGILMFMCGKSRRKIQMVSKNMGVLLVVSVGIIFVFSIIYSIVASNGVLGEKAQEKYERQVKGQRTPLKILMSGRSEFFVGLSACVRKPIFGYGPWPVDEEGIYEKWLLENGDAEDVERYFNLQHYYREAGGVGGPVRTIPCHSVLIQFWLWYGFAGLILWFYVVYRIWIYVRRDMYAVPHYVGYVLGWVPLYLWNIFFSPFGGRLEYGAFLSAMLLCSAVKRGTVALPQEMVHEIEKEEFKKK